MSSPAERYAEFKRGRRTPAFTEFAALYDFPLDDFQVRACHELEAGNGVLVAAPTGSGKTIVGEFAVHLALAQGRKCFYTTPIKALSNQKFGDLQRRYGADHVGLLTGDNTVNGEAPIVVMTTEVLRNMLYAGSSTLTGLGYVVMDEVHYLADRFRGAVWEEVIIHLPESVALVSLSATVSNAEEFGEWLETVRGATTTIVEERRPVPLYQHVMVGRRMYDLFADDGASGPEAKVNPELFRVARDDWRAGRTGDRRGKRGAPQRRAGARGQGGRGPRCPPATTSSRGSTRRVCCPRSCSSSAGSAATPRSSSASTPTCGSPDPPSATTSSPSSRSAAGRSPKRTGTCSATTTSSRGSRAGSRPTTRGCCPRSRSASRRCSPPGGARSCSPPRRSRSGSTCPRAAWSSRSCRSGTARRTPTSPRGSTPSSPDAPGAAASTSRATGSCSGSPAWSRARWPAWPRRAPTRSSRPSGRRTTWRSTWCTRSAAAPRASCWSPRSRSSRPTRRWSGWPVSCARPRRRWRATPRPPGATCGDFMEYAALRRRLSDVEADLARSRRADRRERGAGRRSRRCAPAT